MLRLFAGFVGVFDFGLCGFIGVLRMLLGLPFDFRLCLGAGHICILTGDLGLFWLYCWLLWVGLLLLVSFIYDCGCARFSDRDL